MKDEEINKEYPYPEVTYEVYNKTINKPCGEYTDKVDAFKQIKYLSESEHLYDFVIKKVTKEVMV